MQIRNLLVTLFKAGKMSTEELKREPGLTVCQDIIRAKRQINTVEHKAFLEGITSLSEKLFSSPAVETEMTQANQKWKKDNQKLTFNRLQHLASTKILEQDDFLQVECDICYEEFKENVKGVKLSCLLRQGTSA